MYPPDRLTVSAASAAAHVRHRSTFFPAMAVVLLATVLAGFWNTFFFRPDSSGALALHLQIHGVAVTAWFVLFAVQSLLVASGHATLHRHLGVIGAIVAAGVLVTSLITLVELMPSWRANGVDVDAQRPLLGLIIWGDLGALAAYVGS